MTSVRIPADPSRSVLAFEHGTLTAKLSAPRGRDLQQPHSRDEVYVVVSGNGTFVHGDRRDAFGPGDFLFAAAGVVHRFEDFSDDLAVWVLFYGAEGGEVGDEASVRMAASVRSEVVFEHGTLSVELYAPRGVDKQKPHARDEVYVVVSGNGTFVHGDRSERFAPGDFIFVAAGVEHRFVDFSDDFLVWVFFYG